MLTMPTLTMPRKCEESLRVRTLDRDRALSRRFNELYDTRVDGMRLSIHSIIHKLSQEFFLSAETIEKRLRNGKSAQN